ncbi:hypothetical protein DRQ17_07850, partial [bacterium]
MPGKLLSRIFSIFSRKTEEELEPSILTISEFKSSLENMIEEKKLDIKNKQEDIIQEIRKNLEELDEIVNELEEDVDDMDHYTLRRVVQARDQFLSKYRINRDRINLSTERDALHTLESFFNNMGRATVLQLPVVEILYEEPVRHIKSALKELTSLFKKLSINANKFNDVEYYQAIIGRIDTYYSIEKEIQELTERMKELQEKENRIQKRRDDIEKDITRNQEDISDIMEEIGEYKEKINLLNLRLNAELSFLASFIQKCARKGICNPVSNIREELIREGPQYPEFKKFLEDLLHRIEEGKLNMKKSQLAKATTRIKGAISGSLSST